MSDNQSLSDKLFWQHVLASFVGTLLAIIFTVIALNAYLYLSANISALH